MRYRRELTEQVDRMLAERRRKAQAELDQRTVWAYEKFPRLEELERRQADCLLQLTGQALRNGDRPAAQALVEEARQIALRRTELLRELGLPQNYLSLQPQCEHCGDTGFVEGRSCACYHTTVQQLDYEQSPMGNALRDSRFENFSLDYYGPPGGRARQMMEINLKQARRFADNFEQAAKSLLMQGGVGLGKTHLSAAIGNALSGQGYHVIYESAPTLFNNLEAEKFGRTSPKGLEDYLECDLLLIDDLGSEFITNLVSTALFQVLNGRMIAGRRMVLSTNLTQAELEEHYTQRIISRIMGEFLPLQFVGGDIRNRQAREQLERQ